MAAKDPPSKVECTAQVDICNIRDDIDRIDAEILELINQRLRLAKRIGELKKSAGNQVMDSTRESEVLSRLAALNKGPLNPNVLRHIYIDIIAAARAIQALPRVAYLGPEATFTHIAATTHFGYSVTYVPQTSVRDIFSDVEKGACNYGVVPVENSIEGSVRHTMDLFFESDLRICAERYQPISYDLLAKTPGLGGIAKVYAHPQALDNCRPWLQRQLPQVQLVDCRSTAHAAEKAQVEETAAVVAGAGAGPILKMEVAAQKIEDLPRMPNRFLVIGKEMVRPTGRDKTSLMFALAHTPGALSEVLKPIASGDINLLKLLSRPTHHQNWSHFFFADFEGHETDPAITEAIAQIRPLTLYLKSLGSYAMTGTGD
ncbi:MAG: prephenate dehydratase [Desulfosarcinaceae bacterium]|nr:prephenate dehydratase [Desulfosarcinaceae bacterium]